MPSWPTASGWIPAIGTLLNLGRCYEKIGKTASAWIAYLDAARDAKRAGQAERERAARESANRMAPEVPRLVIRVPPNADVPGLEIKRDGERLPAVLRNVNAPVDPGDHEIECAAPNKKRWSKRVHVEAREEQAVAIPLLEDATPVPGGLSQPPPPQAERAPSGLGTRKTLALVAGGVGVVSMGVGAAFGLSALSNRNRANETCGERGCDPQGLDANNSAHTSATLSTVFFGVGVASLAGGALLWLLAPLPKPAESNQHSTGVSWSVKPEVATTGAAVLVSGDW